MAGDAGGCGRVRRFTGTAAHIGLPGEPVMVRRAINAGVSSAAHSWRRRCRTRECERIRERGGGDES